MRVYVTGITGFAGQWLRRELAATGHDVIGSPASTDLQIADADGLRDHVEAAAPDAIVHLAAVSFAPDATNDPQRAIDTNVAGTTALFNAVSVLRKQPLVVVVSSSEVYGAPEPRDLPLTERAPLRPRHIYGVTKLAQEAVTLWSAARHGIRAVVVRPFNHTGPGQRASFAVPAFVNRMLALRRGDVPEIRAGNVDVQRDIGDVRDVVRAYRLLLEWLPSQPGAPVRVFNVATGHPVAIRTVIDTVCQLGGVESRIARDPLLVREDDPPVIVGSADALTHETGWTPLIPLRTTLADMVAEADAAGRG